jgi:hypothetical protein
MSHARSTIRAQLIHIPARRARSARPQILHPPTHWPCPSSWTGLFDPVARPAPLAA